MMPLETKRLILKPHTSANASLMHVWENDPELLYYSDNQPEDRDPSTIEEVQEYLADIMQEKPQPEIIPFAIHKNSGGEFIGYGMIALIDRYNRQCKLGIVIGNKQDWGQGYGQEALRAIIDYCFNTLNMNRIAAEIYDFNNGAIRLFENLGFIREGTMRETAFKKGKFANEHIYGLLRRDWEGQGAS